MHTPITFCLNFVANGVPYSSTSHRDYQKCAEKQSIADKINKNVMYKISFGQFHSYSLQ